MLSRIGFILGFFALVGCATPTTFGTSASPTPPHMIHQAEHGGQLVMAPNMHAEIVSARLGDYEIYLYDASGKPIAPDRAKVELWLMDGAGIKLQSLPVQIADKGDFFVAKGDPTNITTSNVRVQVALQGTNQIVDIDFTLQYQSTAPIPTLVARATSTVSVARPSAPVTLGSVPAVHWSVTQNEITVKMFFDPYPPRLGTTNTFSILLTDSTGQPLSDATVELTVTGGMAGMMGEHDEDFRLELTYRGAGIYSIQGSPGSSMLEFGGLSLRIARGGRVFAFAISKDELPLR